MKVHHAITANHYVFKNFVVAIIILLPFPIMIIIIITHILLHNFYNHSSKKTIIPVPDR